MFKRIIQNLIPTPLLKHYKKKQYVSILKFHNIDDEPDLKIAQLLVEPGSTVLDIGANIGLYAKYLSPLAQKVICFEPVPFTFEMLTNNLRMLKFQNVEVHQQAISNHNGTTTIEIPIQAGVYNYYRASIEPDNEKSNAISVSIKIQTLDSFLDGYTTPISFVKCDVEGHELAVLEGASKFLQNNDTSWLIEISGNPDEENSSAAKVVALMNSLGYSTYHTMNGVFTERKTGQHSVNYFFLKEKHVNLIRCHKSLS